MFWNLHPTPQRCKDDQWFEVLVGHAVLRVEARDIQDAIQQARLRLRRELPRLWDVITGLDVSRFEVRRLMEG